MRRISIWTAALALGSLIGSGAVAVVARAATQAGSRVSSSDGAQSGRAEAGAGSGDESRGLLPPLGAPGPDLQQTPPLGSTGGS